ncbi:hypothetical protein J9B83_12370 [Marinomonas sp. A79]|uniref:Uncharacterized protein n=1 Tax=Marinomonas vulgaris TaxID=2823372 RepID=A0ABS5HDK0_9GAMM|nr:hypothetical protein [Marinomonas vulgaris]MBR7889731.1 hypothetical protein [Marinomonas vulgaris]
MILLLKPGKARFFNGQNKEIYAGMAIAKLLVWFFIGCRGFTSLFLVLAKRGWMQSERSVCGPALWAIGMFLG